jgi:hypothetical protein
MYFLRSLHGNFLTIIKYKMIIMSRVFNFRAHAHIQHRTINRIYITFAPLYTATKNVALLSHLYTLFDDIFVVLAVVNALDNTQTSSNKRQLDGDRPSVHVATQNAK